MRFIFIDKVGGARGTLFTERDIIHSDNVISRNREFPDRGVRTYTDQRLEST